MLALIGSNGAGKTTPGQPDQRADPGRLRAGSSSEGDGHHRSSPSTGRSSRASRAASSSSTSSTSSARSTMWRCHLLPRGQDAKAAVAVGVRYRGAGRGAWDPAAASGSRPRRAMVAGGLSQGERKLLDVAVAYALRPKLLFLDEPTSGVSTREKAPIMDIITSVVRSGGITAVIIEHDMDVVFTYCRPHRGHAPGHDPRRRHARRDPEQRAGDRQPARHPRHAEARRWRAAPCSSSSASTPSAGPAQVLRDVSLTVGDGESVCLVGRNGAGKTTTIDSIMGLLPVRSGTLTFKGADITRLPTHERARCGIGYSPEDAGIFPDLTVAENFQISQSLGPRGASGRGGRRHRRARPRAVPRGQDVHPAAGPLPVRRPEEDGGHRAGPDAVARRSCSSTSPSRGWRPWWSPASSRP